MQFSKYNDEIMKILEDYEAALHICLGYPEGEPGAPKSQREGRVSFVR